MFPLIDLMLRFMGTSIPAQLEKPEGLIGRWLTMGWLETGNARLNEYCIGLMELKSTDRVLEIGFGPGDTLATMAKTAAHVAGADFSKEMCEEAISRNRRQIAEGKMQIRCASVDAMPYPDADFDKIFTANTIYFWPDPAASAREVLRVLQPGGALYIGYRPKSIMQKIPILDSRFQMFEHEDIEKLFRDAGATGEIRTEHRAETTALDSYCAIVRK